MHRGATMYPVSSSDRTANKEEKLQYEESDKMSVPNFYKVMKGLRHILNALAFDDRIPEDVFTNDDVDTLCNAENILAVLENQKEQIPIINVFLSKNKTTIMDTVLAAEEELPITVGDEVVVPDINDVKYVVSFIYKSINPFAEESPEYLHLIEEPTGRMCTFRTASCKKTGRYFPQIKALLDAMDLE